MTTTRKKNQRSISAVFVTLMLVLSAVSARGAFVNYSVGSGGLASFNITWDGNNVNALAGGLLLSKVSGDASMPNSILTVCTDIGGTLFLGRTYGYSDSTPFAGQSGINPTWGAGNQGGLTSMANAMAGVQAAAHLFYTHSSVLNGGTQVQKSALQIAIWEALYDTMAGGTTYQLNDGRFKVNSGNADAVTTALGWLNAINSSAPLYAGYLLKPDPAQQHGYLGQEVFYNVTPVPEASTIIAGALLLLPFAASTLRKLRKSSTARS